jgi:hypothetical protein
MHTMAQQTTHPLFFEYTTVLLTTKLRVMSLVKTKDFGADDVRRILDGFHPLTRFQR